MISSLIFVNLIIIEEILMAFDTNTNPSTANTPANIVTAAPSVYDWSVAPQGGVNYIEVRLNVGSFQKNSPKDTPKMKLLRYTHNGAIIQFSATETGAVQFSLVSKKDGGVPMRLVTVTSPTVEEIAMSKFMGTPLSGPTVTPLKSIEASDFQAVLLATEAIFQKEGLNESIQLSFSGGERLVDIPETNAGHIQVLLPLEDGTPKVNEAKDGGLWPRIDFSNAPWRLVKEGIGAGLQTAKVVTQLGVNSPYRGMIGKFSNVNQEIAEKICELLETPKGGNWAYPLLLDPTGPRQLETIFEMVFEDKVTMAFLYNGMRKCITLGGAAPKRGFKTWDTVTRKEGGTVLEGFDAQWLQATKVMEEANTIFALPSVTPAPATPDAEVKEENYEIVALPTAPATPDAEMEEEEAPLMTEDDLFLLLASAKGMEE